MKTVLVTDCGSTTTKALLFQETTSGWRCTFRGEAPTTVEEPIADVTVGARNAFSELEEISGRKILDENASPPILPSSAENPNHGVDAYLSTSSAGGGLQMLVSGLVRKISAESAERAALGAGAIVLDVLSLDDGREDYERIERIRHLRPDIVLLAGGTDGGSKSNVIEMAELILAAQPRPRFGKTLRLPIIFAGNSELSAAVEEILGSFAQVAFVSNVRPTLEHESLRPARDAIHDFFLTHVMSHAPGYDKLLTWASKPIVPTPAAVGQVVEKFARAQNLAILCADIGGATTDLFSVCRSSESDLVFNRTVSANYGMSYSIANVMVEAGVENIRRWLPYDLSPGEVRDRLRNKMIRPTSIPQTKDDLALEQAVCREALRLSLNHHRSLAVGLSGAQRKRGIADIFSQSANRQELVETSTFDMVIGSGGVLSHAPLRLQAALMMLEGFELWGFVELGVDSIFMMPHLGVFSEINPKGAEEIFLQDCLIRICHALAPRFNPTIESGTPLVEVKINGREVGVVKAQQFQRLELPEGSEVSVELKALKSGVELASDGRKAWHKKIIINKGGLLLDGRNRPLSQKSNSNLQQEERRNILKIIEGT